jgi:hypothetical protein
MNYFNPYKELGEGGIRLAMTYSNLIESLFENFPLKKAYIDEGEYIAGLPHLVFSFVFVPFIKNVVVNDSVEEIKKICVFLEDMAVCDDKSVFDVLILSVLENLLYERRVVNILKPYLRQKSAQLLLEIEKTFGIDSESTR